MLWWSARKLDLHPAVRHLIGTTVGMAALQVLSVLIVFPPCLCLFSASTLKCLCLFSVSTLKFWLSLQCITRLVMVVNSPSVTWGFQDYLRGLVV